MQTCHRELKLGSSVAFNMLGNVLSGLVIDLNSTRAVVAVPRDRQPPIYWTVHPALLRPLSQLATG